MAGRSFIGGEERIRCSFCGKSQEQVRKLIAGPNGAYICDVCVDICAEIIEEEFEEEDEEQVEEQINLLKPEELKNFLDEYVIGQDNAKKVLSVAVYNHYKRILAGTDLDVELQKSNILMLGPTGSGKTYLAQTLARILNVPFAIADATTLTEAGYVGEDVENILLKIIQAADYDIDRAQHGIIYIDEIDKITNILFICGGAFDGLEKIIESRLDEKTIGFNATVKDRREMNVGKAFKHAMPQDFIKFGLIPEFIGRVPVTVSLDSLDKEALVRILTEPKNSLIKQYKKLFELDGVALHFNDDAVEAVAGKALDRQTGARGLRAIMENVMMDLMYKIPSDSSITECTIDKALVEQKGYVDSVEEDEQLLLESKSA